MTPFAGKSRRRGTVLLMIVGLLAMLFILVSAYIVLARFDRQTVRLAGQADQLTDTLNGINNVLAATIRGSSTTKGGAVTGAAYADTQGYKGLDASGNVWGKSWLASPEPVRDFVLPSVNGYWPGDYVFPGVTGLSGAVSVSKSLTGLMLDADPDGGNKIVDIRPGDPKNPGSLPRDTLANAREPLGDADGDGIADSFFGGVGVLTELANAMTGRSIQAMGIDPSKRTPVDHRDPDYGNYLAWEQYDSQARYAVAAKIISHGGMVQISFKAPTNTVQWNSAFLAGMFNWIRDPDDYPSYLDPINSLLHRNWMRQLWAESAVVEPALRRRGGLLVGELAEQEEGVPAALWNLQNGGFRDTVCPTYDYNFKTDSWQRFNLASQEEWTAWRQAALVDAVDFNTFYDHGNGMGGPDPRVQFVPRQLLTTVNNSDELARLRSVEPGVDATQLGLYGAGRVKFYLGNIWQAFDSATGKFQYDQSSATYDGYELIRDLARYYYEMLGDYVVPTSLNLEGEWKDSDQYVSPLEQAYMLAVNTVAFAAPRVQNDVLNNGKIDVVYYEWGGTKKFCGYAPQPYITQVLAYNKVTGDPPSDHDIALAIELYFPGDPDSDGWDGTGLWNTDDEFAINLGQFAIKLNNRDPAVPGYLKFLNAIPNVGERMSGRRFLAFTINDEGGNTELDNALHVNSRIVNDMPVDYLSDTSGERIEIELWRVGINGDNSHMVDRFTLDLNPSYPGDLTEWLADAYRDTSPMLEYGEGPSGLGTPLPARWRMTMDASTSVSPITGSQLPTELLNRKLTIGDEYVWSGSAQTVPIVNSATAIPLLTMNAGVTPWGPIHGSYRPESFPTVGFMLFIPRFTHMDIGGTDPHPMSEILREQWKGHGSTGYLQTTVPADFGHMPIFDNDQDPHNTSDFDNSKAGKVPWGLMVFDYFTTINPAGPDGVLNTFDDIDPYRVPGRVNINTAPWYVLAGLPVIGPANGDPDGQLPISTRASPAFWSPDAGVLAGRGTPLFAVPRFIGNRDGRLLSPATWGGGWWRLGPDLAQAASAYRDRVQYTNQVDVPVAFHWAHMRKAYRSGRYKQIRGGGLEPGTGQDNQLKRGFLTLGELANVPGFDSSLDSELNAGADATVLGGYGDPANPGDFVRAVSVLALLDTQFLTTRSNTYTVYVTLNDRENPQASVRSQMTVDRSNLLPRLIWRDINSDLVHDAGDQYTVIEDTGLPEVIGKREISYFNARYDN